MSKDGAPCALDSAVHPREWISWSHEGHTDARGLNRSIQAVWPSLAIKVHLAQLGTFRSTVDHGPTELPDG